MLYWIYEEVRERQRKDFPNWEEERPVLRLPLAPPPAPPEEKPGDPEPCRVIIIDL